MAKAKVVELVALECVPCSEGSNGVHLRNYTTSKNRRTVQGKLELMKYCPRLPGACPAPGDAGKSRASVPDPVLRPCHGARSWVAGCLQMGRAAEIVCISKGQ